MRKSGLFFIWFVAFFISCASKKENVTKTANEGTQANYITAKGIVSHRFKTEGCGTVIICINESDTLFLIPQTPLNKFDVDGMKVEINYRALKIHNPKGCHTGSPVQITEIKKARK